MASPEELAVTVEQASQTLLALSMRALAAVEGRASIGQVRALLVLDHHGPLAVGRLGRELGLSAPSTSRLVDRLTAAGLVTRQVPAHSRREVLIVPSRSARALLQALVRRRRRQLATVLAQMTPQDREALAASLQRFAAAATSTGPAEVLPA